MINDYRKWPIKRLGFNWAPSLKKRPVLAEKSFVSAQIQISVKVRSSVYLKLGVNLNKRKKRILSSILEGIFERILWVFWKFTCLTLFVIFIFYIFNKCLSPFKHPARASVHPKLFFLIKGLGCLISHLP